MAKNYLQSAALETREDTNAIDWVFESKDHVK